jgi:predicted nucleic acid-binding protein
VLEEVWHVEVTGRAGPLAGLTQYLYTILTPLIPVTDEAFGLAISLQGGRLGPNDRLHVGTCLTHGIDTIVSADRAFDGVRDVRRVDPLDERAIRLLLGARN